MQAVILAGGKGTRLTERLNGRPKPLIDVCGVPLLERQIRALEAYGIRDVLVLVNHAADQIAAFFAARDFGCVIQLVDDGDPRGTAGAVLACLDRLDERFLVVYGDTLFDIDVPHMLAAHEAAGAEATLLLHPNDHPADSDLVEMDDAGRVTCFHSYPHPPGAELCNLVNAAFYVIERRALERWAVPGWSGDFAKDLFPAMIAAGVPLHGYASYEYIKDLGTPSRLDKVERHLRDGVVARASRAEKQAAVFVDRDGTLNQLRGYIRSAPELDLIPGAGAAIHALNAAERRVVLVTNQPVIARGDVDAAGMHRIQARLETLLGQEGGYLDASYLCPHHPDSGFLGEVAALKIRCACRKPGTGLFDDAIAALNIDPDRSWMIGDSTADMLAAERIGLRRVLVETGEGGRDEKCAGTADFTVADIGEAVSLILDEYPRYSRIVAPLAQVVAPGDVVLIGGLARSGKSGLAATLRTELRLRGLAATSLSLDRWLLPDDKRGEGLTGRFALDEMRENLAPWLAGGAADIALPFYDRMKRTRKAGDTIALTQETVLILEGVPALLLPSLGDRRCHKVFVQAEEPGRHARVVDDLVARNLASEGAAEQIYRARQQDEAAQILAAADRATHLWSLESSKQEVAA
jgi:histidinol-phosphate phosphatase family protein